MGCYFCIPNEKNDVKTLESDTNTIITELRTIQRPSQRLYTVREEQHETSECSDTKLRLE